MAFSVNALTEAGNALLAQASAANPIVYIYAIGSTYSFTAEELAQMDDVQSGDWDITNGFIVASSATNNTARIIAGFANQATSKVMKTVAIVGRLQSQSDSQAIVVAAVSDDSASIRIPALSDPPVRIEVALNITISDIQSVVVTSSTAGSAMLSDLDRLVSCHKPGQPYSGDNQNVYGKKTFLSDIVVGDPDGVSMTIHGEEQGHYGYGSIVVKNDDEYTNMSLIFNLDGVQQIECNANFLPYDHEVFNLGSSNYRWDQTYTRQIFCDQVFVGGTINPISGGVNIGNSSNHFGNIHASDFHLYDSYTNTNTLTISSDEVNEQISIDATDNLDITCQGVLRVFPSAGARINAVTRVSGLFFIANSPLDANTSCFCPNPTAMKAGTIFLGFIQVSQQASITLNAGALIPSGVLVCIAKAVSSASVSGAPSYTSGYSFANDGSRFRILCDTASMPQSYCAIVPILCVKDL